jgi:hypothetical protein
MEEEITSGRTTIYCADGTVTERAFAPAELMRCIKARDALRAKLARPRLYLPSRGLSARGLLAFAKKSHKPEIPLPPLDVAAAEAIATRDWDRYLGLFDSHQRMFPFLTVHAGLTREEYWAALALVWTTAEWGGEFGRLWDWLFLHNRDHSGALAMMDRGERKAWDALPDEFTVYRGQQRKNDVGISWSLSRERASWFATNYRPRFTDKWRKGPGVLLVATVEKSDALAYLNSRDEEEVLIPVGKVRGIRYERPNNAEAELAA